MDEYNYDALASTVQIEDISSNERNQEILRRLKENDPSLGTMWIRNEVYDRDSGVYCPGDDVDELGWLGYYLGRNKSLQELFFQRDDLHNTSFYRGLNFNTSIQTIALENAGLLNGQVFGMLDQFFTNNRNLTEIRVMGCDLTMEGVR